MKNVKIKKKFKELVEKAKKIENQCKGEIIDFIRTKSSEEIFIDSRYLQILNN